MIIKLFCFLCKMRKSIDLDVIRDWYDNYKFVTLEKGREIFDKFIRKYFREQYGLRLMRRRKPFSGQLFDYSTCYAVPGYGEIEWMDERAKGGVIEVNLLLHFKDSKLSKKLNEIIRESFLRIKRGEKAGH